ncbi:MAG: hypothetical protein OEZ22_02380 [Spirochaetia bacterium]|nr:hypothetical protein [Spirochaetia bacterium]
MRVDPPKHLKPFIKSYNILEYNFSKEEIKTSDIYIPAWTKNFFLFFCKDIWDVELSNGKYLTGYDTMFTGCMTYGLRYIRKNPNAYIIAIELQPETLYHILKKDISFMTNNSVYAEKIIPKSGEILIQLKEEKKTKDRIEILNHFL